MDIQTSLKNVVDELAAVSCIGMRLVDFHTALTGGIDDGMTSAARQLAKAAEVMGHLLPSHLASVEGVPAAAERTTEATLDLLLFSVTAYINAFRATFQAMSRELLQELYRIEVTPDHEVELVEISNIIHNMVSAFKF